MASNEKHVIALRAYTKLKSKKRKKKRPFQEPIPYFDRVIVFDTETTTDLKQNLKFGYFEVYVHDTILEGNGLFYDPKMIKPKELVKLKKYSKKNNIPLNTIDEFRKYFCKETYLLESLCVGFNLPFDLSRIAIDSSTGRKGKEHFSLKMSKDRNYLRLKITHHSNTLSFIKWGTRKKDSKYFQGNFLDLRTLSNALTDKKFTLEKACEEFDTEYKKTKQIKHGIVNKEYIDYCINDVKSTYSLYLKAKKEFEKYQINIPITKASTPAKIGKQFLKQMGISSFFEKNQNFPDEILGNTMTGYSGGRTECKIRKKPVKVDVLDFLSMYPTVCTLQNLWKFVIAKKIKYEDATDECRNFVNDFTIQKIQDPKNWLKLPAICLVEPQDDVIPIRAQFNDDKYVWNIGMCHVTSKRAMWVPLADVLGSKLITGKKPKILKVIRFVPIGVQENLKPIEVHGKTINPYTQDLFKELIEYRQILKNKKDSREHVIKIIANAISYGIFVQIDTNDRVKSVPIEVYGLDSFENEKKKVETAGYMFNPIIAVAITSASRLLLATTESLLARNGVIHSYCDTDSMFVPPEHTKQIQGFFDKLNPYSFDARVFKKENDESLWFYGISSKRYCLYTIDEKTKEISIGKDDYSAHGLGHLLDPFTNDPDEESDWHDEVWYDILKLHYKQVTKDELREKYENKYALQQLSVTTPTILNRFKNFNSGKNYHNQIKPQNFCMTGFSNEINENTGEHVKPLAPYQRPPKNVVYDYFIDHNDSDFTKIRGKQYWKPLWDLIEGYSKHPEGKFDGDEGILRRKHVQVTRIIHIGKESNDIEEAEIFGLNESSYVTYSNYNEINKKFENVKNLVLKLRPIVVRPYINRKTLWKTQNNVRENQLNRISQDTKIKLLEYFTSIGLT